MPDDRDLPVPGDEDGLTVLQLLEQLKHDYKKQDKLIKEALVRERYVLGDQWLANDPMVETLFGDSFSSGATENLLYPNVLTYSARVNQGRAQVKGYPVHPTPEDKASARGMNALLDYERRECDEDALIIEAGFLAQCHGDVLFYGPYDEGKGPQQARRQVVDEIGPVVDEQGNPVLEDAWEYGGNAEEIIAAPDYWTDIVDDYDRHASYLVVRRLIDKVTAKKIITKAGFDVDNISENSREENPQDLDRSGVEAYEIWLKPGARYKDGLFALVIAGYVCKCIPFPYKHGLLPGAVWKIQKVRGSPRGKTHVSDAIHQQRLVNTYLRAIMRRVDLSGDASLIGPSGLLEQWKVSNGGRRLVVSDMDGEKDPRFIVGPDAPKSQFDGYQLAKRALQDTFGQNEATMSGGDPTQTSSGEQLKTASALDQQKLVAARRSLEHARLRMARIKVAHCIQFWDNARMVRVLGPGGEYEVEWIKGADLGGADVALEIVSGVMNSRLGASRLAEESAQAGYLDPKMAAEMRQTGLATTFDDGMQRQRLDAQAMAALRGQPQEPLRDVPVPLAVEHLADILLTPVANAGDKANLRALIDAYKQAQAQAKAPQPNNGPGKMPQPSKPGATKFMNEQAPPEALPQ